MIFTLLALILAASPVLGADLKPADDAPSSSKTAACDQPDEAQPKFTIELELKAFAPYPSYLFN